MEGAAREMNLNDLSNRIEKIIADAAANRDRATEAGDLLAGAQPMDAVNKAGAPSPAALLHRIGQQLGFLESLMVDQRVALNRVHAALQDAPPKALGQNITNHHMQAAGGISRY